MNHRPFRRWLTLGLALALGAIRSVAADAAVPPADDIFHSPELLRIAITLPDKGWAELAATASGSGHTKPKAKATVREGGRTYRDVAVQLKGFTTFQPLEGTPSLTLDFNQFVPGQNFQGLTKISLNNSLQDPTKLHEKFARELFTDAGVPVPRADHALVSLNGRNLGLYVLVEGFDKTFLRRHFTDASGNLYEGGTLQDIHRQLQFKSGRDAKDRSDVERLIRAAREPDPERRFAALTNVLDLDRFLSMVAVESMLCHSDSYSMNRNNYRLYHDPASDRLVFLPHGMDRILGTHRSRLDLPVVPPAMGLVARAILSTPEGRRRYVERAGSLFTNLFYPERLCRRVQELDAKIARERSRHPGDRQAWGGAGRDPGDDGTDLCRRIERRATELKLQFLQRDNLLAIAPIPLFDTNRVTALTGWRVRWALNQPPAELSPVTRDGRQLLHVRSPGNALATTLYCQLRLPVDHYRLTGRLTPVAAETEVQTGFTVLRYSADRFDALPQRLGNRLTGHSFQVAPALAPETVEFLCTVKAATNEVWLDPGSLLLTRGMPAKE